MMKSTSRINTLYNVLIAVCFYSAVVRLFMDTFVHRRQLMYAMKKVRLLIGFILMAWMHISLRYDVLGSTYMDVRAFEL
jgi:hypothetical protein